MRVKCIKPEGNYSHKLILNKIYKVNYEKGDFYYINVKNSNLQEFGFCKWRFQEYNIDKKIKRILEY
jgi:hypothetical protein